MKKQYIAPNVLTVHLPNESPLLLAASNATFRDNITDPTSSDAYDARSNQGFFEEDFEIGNNDWDELETQ